MYIEMHNQSRGRTFFLHFERLPFLLSTGMTYFTDVKLIVPCSWCIPRSMSHIFSATQDNKTVSGVQ
jgi:hypothetical protein